MNTKTFNQILEDRITNIRAILEHKAKEYAQNDDRLHNFNVGAKIKDITAIQALDGMMLKHYICYQDMVNGHLPLTEELINEKLGDLINYFILAEACFKEQLLAEKAIKKHLEPKINNGKKPLPKPIILEECGFPKENNLEDLEYLCFTKDDHEELNYVMKLHKEFKMIQTLLLNKIIETRKPLIKAFRIMNGVFTCIDNSKGDAFVEDFTNPIDAYDWLSTNKSKKEIIDER